MKIVVETHRLLLREFEVSDAKDLLKLNSDPEVLKYTGDDPFTSVDDARLFLRNYNDYQKNGFGRWAVILKKTHQFIGWCGLKLNEEKQVDLGFRFYKNEWNKGYATESSKASLKYGYEELDIQEIIGRAALENKASIKVLEKTGMTFWKHTKIDSIPNAVLYKLHKQDYASKGHDSKKGNP
ncbi:GNAT family N-acetyltransferase [Aquimarina sp. SS2-1]|uniref:GNAT family N-acetyltransferase n=1 Tax=Aquimarina besae TaxID=3342247 RepID=UPI00366C3A4F